MKIRVFPNFLHVKGVSNLLCFCVQKKMLEDCQKSFFSSVHFKFYAHTSHISTKMSINAQKFENNTICSWQYFFPPLRLFFFNFFFLFWWRIFKMCVRLSLFLNLNSEWNSPQAKFVFEVGMVYSPLWCTWGSMEENDWYNWWKRVSSLG